MNEPDDLPESGSFQRMNCMEVRGGNCGGAEHLETAGLEVWVWSRSGGETSRCGGDVHYLSSCASGRITRMMLADVCAHGTVFTGVAEGLRDLMLRNVNSIKQSRLVGDLSRHLRSFYDQGGLTTALVATFFAPTRSLAVCNAGYPPPLLYEASSQQWTVLKKTMQPDSAPEEAPGVVNRAEYQEFRQRLEPGDMLLSYGNAVGEACDEAGHSLSTGRLLELIRQMDGRRPNDILQRLVGLVRGTTADRGVADDATVLLCRATGTGVGWKNNLLAPFRLLRPAHDRTDLVG